jgi:hypothetical protein
MNLAVALGLVDGVVAMYLLAWALRREKRDKPAVAIVGGMLVVCAVVLVVAGVRRTETPQPAQPTPTAPPGPAQASPATAI